MEILSPKDGRLANVYLSAMGTIHMGLWEDLKKKGYDALFVNGCCEHTEYSDTAFCDMNENIRDEILLRCYKPFIPILIFINEYLYNDK